MNDETSEEKVKPKRAPLKRTSAKSTTKKVDGDSAAPRKRAARQRASRTSVEKVETPKPVKKIEEPVVQTKTEEKVRKAPTPLSYEAKEKRAKKVRAIVASVILIIGAGSSAVVGYTDKGGIDVNKAIEERNERTKQSGSGGEIIPVQNTSQAVDGGLIGGTSGTPKETPVAEVVATTTDEQVETDSVEQGSVPASPSEAAAASKQPATTTSSGN